MSAAVSGRTWRFALSSIVLPALAACGGGGDGTAGSNGHDGLTTLASVALEMPGSHCSAGGGRISAGLDANGNGVLDDAEVSSTQYVCNGLAGTTGGTGAAGPAGAPGSNGFSVLVAMAAEPAGANCAHGGKKLNAGLDGNGNGVLDAAEVTSSGYVCNGADGGNGPNGLNSLIAVTPEAPGANCSYGGSKVASGLDSDGNGHLDAAEVTATTYLCRSAATLIALSTEPPGGHCAAGGTRIDAGLDGNANAVLDANEVGSTEYVCNGTSGASGLTDLSLLAGSIGGTGFIDGSGPAARFNHPQGVAIDPAGNLYVADMINHVVRKITPAGLVSTLTDPANSCGLTALPGLCGPFAVAVDNAGFVYVTDNSSLIHKVSPDGVVTTFAVLPPPRCNPIPMPPLQPVPCPDRTASGIAVDAAGFVYVALSADNVILKISPDGNATTFAGAPSSNAIDGPGDQARFFSLGGLAIDGAGNLFVADGLAVRKITPLAMVSTIAGSYSANGSIDGYGSDAVFTSAHAVAVDALGNVYVADTNNQTVRRISPSGMVNVVAGFTGQPGVRLGAYSGLYFPQGIAVVGPNRLAITSENAVLIADLP